uniref:All-trans-retinol 13,14-reductase n=1 Tax=Sinocyclocheilus grahami TaxID=75366 RepID=A0A672RN64_SINGR
MWIAVVVISLALVAIMFKYVLGTPGPSPFAIDRREPLKPMVLDRKLKNKVLKQGFLASKVPQDLDAIVVGSGIGGLAIAVLLAKVGKKVLVLEQHDRAGGCCHTFTEQGFEFDVGIHYIGELLDHKPLRCLIDQLTNGQLQWEPLDNPFDNVVLGPPENRRIYPIYSGKKRYIDELKKCFPGEEKAIDEYVRLSKKVANGVWFMVLLKLLPTPLAKFLVHTGLANRLSSFFRYASRSLTDVVNELTQNKDLRAVMCYIFGTYGKMPKEASFSMHSLLLCHYLNGAWYPKGGASEIAYHMIPIIEKAGGAVLVRAPVNRILLNDAKEAIGVSVLKGQEEVHVHAPIVISDAGIFNTYEHLLPKDVQTMPAIQKQLSMVQHGDGGLSIFIGVDGTKEELGLKADNYFIFPENNLDELACSFLNHCPSALEESSKNVPMIFVASPSAKDPTWPERKPGKSTVTVVSFANYAWFEEWKDDKVKNRSIDYKELKEAFISKILEAVTEIFPKIKDRIEYVDAGTPITNQHYIGAPKGEIYGADHGIPRFSVELNATIRPQTPIKNLFLTGQDVMLCGFAGALTGAVTCGSVILNRNLHLDAIGLAKRVKNGNNKKKE